MSAVLTPLGPGILDLERTIPLKFFVDTAFLQITEKNSPDFSFFSSIHLPGHLLISSQSLGLFLLQYYHLHMFIFTELLLRVLEVIPFSFLLERIHDVSSEALYYSSQGHLLYMRIYEHVCI